jgi:hypothetical protein
MVIEQDGPSDAKITHDALGRPVFLGQLYNAHTGCLLNDSLFKQSAINDPARRELPDTNQSRASEYNTIEHLDKRESLLDLSRSVTVKVMSGALEIHGQAHYLDRSDSSESSASLASSVHLKTGGEGLLIEAVESEVAVTGEKLKMIGATHVVIKIGYGGSMIASLTQSNSSMNKEMHLDGGGSLAVLKSLGALGSAKGEVKIDNMDKRDEHRLLAGGEADGRLSRRRST